MSASKLLHTSLALREMASCLQQYWNSSQPYKHISVPAFAELFKHHKVGQETAARLAEGPDRAALEKQGDTSKLLIKKKYALSNTALFHACWQVRVMSVCDCVLCNVCVTVCCAIC